MYYGTTHYNTAIKSVVTDCWINQINNPINTYLNRNHTSLSYFV